MKKNILVLATLALFCVPLASAQSQVSHNVALTNLVSVTARHCQAYMHDVYGQNAEGKIVVERRELGEAGKAACAADSSTVYFTETNHNLLTNAGKDAIASQVANTATQAAACNYIALTNDATAPAAGDTTLTSEIATNGLSRAQGTYAHTGGTSTLTVTKTFNATGTQASQKAGLFNATSAGTLCFENTYTAVTVNNGDTLTVTWTITLS